MTRLDRLRHTRPHGIFLRREALAAGLSDQDLRKLLRSGDIVRVRHGAYVHADGWLPLSIEDRHVVHVRAVLLTHAERVTVSHFSAVLAHRMDLWGAPLDRVHLTRLDAGSGRTTKDVVHHEGLWLPSDLMEVRGLPVVRPARAALESACLLGAEAGLAVLDSGLRMELFTVEELTEQARLMRSWPDARRLEIIVRLADGRSGSVGESRSRYIFWRFGIPKPELQWPVYDENGELIGYADFAWPSYGVLGEFDGKAKYTRLLREHENVSDVVLREKNREDAMRRATRFTFHRWGWPVLDTPQVLVNQTWSALRSAA
jgi:hypothetical protein